MYNAIIKMVIALTLVGYGMAVSNSACARGITVNHLLGLLGNPALNLELS